MLLHFYFTFSHFPNVLLVFTRPLMGKLSFHGYVILRFYPTHEICKKFHVCENNVVYSILYNLI